MNMRNQRPSMKEKVNGTRATLNFADLDLARQLFGEQNNNLKRLAEAIDITIDARGHTLFIQGDSITVRLAQKHPKATLRFVRGAIPHLSG